MTIMSRYSKEYVANFDAVFGKKEEPQKLKRFWISWYEPHIEKFEYHGPWWISGQLFDGSLDTVCAAVIAKDEESARQKMLNCYDDKRVPAFNWRFCEERPDDWEPFNGRFPRADWMKWP